MKLVLFGAGNIGRSFVAPLFVDAGYDVVFIDINKAVLSEINRRGEYSVVVVSGDEPPQSRTVRNVRAVDGRLADEVTGELASATIAATAVGKAALPTVARSLAAGIKERRARGGGPLNVILAENVREAASQVRATVDDLIGSTAHDLGLVETSIGKMVPIVPAEEAQRDPLIVYAEPYNTLIVDQDAFIGQVPQVRGLSPVGPIAAYVDRKLFIHNLGHAVCAYLSYADDPSVTGIAAAIVNPEIQQRVRKAMDESAEGLMAEYPGVFTNTELSDHIEDLISRFANTALGDTIHRVGRDLPRKLSRNDRLVGAMRTCARHGLPFDAVADAYLAALRFLAPDESGAPFPADAEVSKIADTKGLRWALNELSGLNDQDKTDRAVIDTVTAASQRPKGMKS